MVGSRDVSLLVYVQRVNEHIERVLLLRMHAHAPLCSPHTREKVHCVTHARGRMSTEYRQICRLTYCKLENYLFLLFALAHASAEAAACKNAASISS